MTTAPRRSLPAALGEEDPETPPRRADRTRAVPGAVSPGPAARALGPAPEPRRGRRPRARAARGPRPRAAGLPRRGGRGREGARGPSGARDPDRARATEARPGGAARAARGRALPVRAPVRGEEGGPPGRRPRASSRGAYGLRGGTRAGGRAGGRRRPGGLPGGAPAAVGLGRLRGGGAGRGRGSRRAAPGQPWALSPWLSCGCLCVRARVRLLPEGLVPSSLPGSVTDCSAGSPRAEGRETQRVSRPPGSMASPRLSVGPGAHMPSGAPLACVPGACHPPGRGHTSLGRLHPSH